MSCVSVLKLNCEILYKCLEISFQALFIVLKMFIVYNILKEMERNLIGINSLFYRGEEW